MVIRHRSRHLRATLFNRVVAELTVLGWVGVPVNFGADPVTVIDYQPDERSEPILKNTVALSLGDAANDLDEELGAGFPGGLRSASVPVFIDCYMASQALADALCDDIRAIFDMQVFPLVDQVTGLDCVGETVEIEEVLGPNRPAGGATGDVFKRYWRIMNVGVRLYYHT